jgi:hypothetical protein
MRKFLFVLASTGSLTTMNAAIAQYAPGYYAPGYTARGYAPGYYVPGYTWRDQRERAMEDWRQWQYYEKQRTPNDATGRGSVGATVGTSNAVDSGFVGECAVGMSEETCRRRGQRYNPPNNATNSDATVGTNNAVDSGFVGECAIGMSEETCRRRGQR